MCFSEVTHLLSNNRNLGGARKSQIRWIPHSEIGVHQEIARLACQAINLDVHIDKPGASYLHWLPVTRPVDLHLDLLGLVPRFVF